MKQTETQKMIEKLIAWGAGFPFLAFKLGVAENTIRNYLAGDTEPKGPALKVLERIFHKYQKQNGGADVAK